MTLWNIIRDFFVQYIFGGTDSLNVGYSSFVGYLFTASGNAGNQLPNYDNATTDLFFVNIGNQAISNDLEYQGIMYMSIGDWLSTTFTIITLIAICFFLFLVVRWLFRLTAGLIQGRG